MKERIEKQICDLIYEREQVLSIDTNFDSKLDFGLNLLLNLDKFFGLMDVETKINEFVNTIFRDNTRYRTKIKRLTSFLKVSRIK